MARNWIAPSDAALDHQIEVARARSRAAAETEPRAKSARYNRRTGRIEIELKDGCLFAFPPDVAQGLRGASPKQLAGVAIEGGGFALRWEEIDADVTIPSLIAGRFGGKRWMTELGRAGGRARSERKTRAVRANGMKGGRPRKART